MASKKEIQIAAHDEMRHQSDLRSGSAAVDQEIVEHPKGKSTLGPRALVDGGSDISGAQFVNEFGEQVGGNNGKTVQDASVAGGLDDGNRGFCGYVKAGEIGMGHQELAALIIGFGFGVVVFDRIKDLHIGMKRGERGLKCT